MAKSEYKSITADTQRLIDGQEGLEVEFKSEPSGVKPETLVAFANGIGGTILVGVDESTSKKELQRGVVVGSKVGDKIKQGFVSTANSCRPPIEISIRVENSGSDKPIFRLDVSEGADKPYATSSGLYKIRSEGQNVAIDPGMITAIILEREADEFVSRFKHASDELVTKLNEIYRDLENQIIQVGFAANNATEAAKGAENAAREAIEAAQDAAAVAHDAMTSAMDAAAAAEEAAASSEY